MAYITTRPTQGFSNPLRGIGQRIANGFRAVIVANSRVAQVEALNAKSDEQLAQMGLRREDIVRHVFRDTMYL
ncbi:hypothetical protein LCGC14_2483900 [marine sediment metagenome]|uniref:DUF1127 domain-containing protein n=1 Tax=marine sediment metagenome TaxID=412755 RepID=A0A0F9B7H5_9ZZZZ